MQKIVVTGVNGFVGKHLVRELVSQDIQVIGIGQGPDADLEISDQLSSYIQCDLSNSHEVSRINLEGVTAIISLAGLANVGESFKNPSLYMRTNTAVFTNLGEYLLSKWPSIRIIAISTGAVYSPEQSLPLTENAQTTKSSPYAESKLNMEHEALKLIERGLDCVIVRPFNHIGPGQQPGFLLPDLATQIQQAITDDSYTITVGDLSSKRDFTDVRDVVRAYRLLATTEKPQLKSNVYNVCSGRSIAGQEIFNTLSALMSPSHVIHAEIDESRLRPDDPKDLYGSNEKLKQDCGWQPEITLEQTIRDYISWLAASN